MNYLEATITGRPDNVKSISEARAKLIVALWKSASQFFAPPADSLVRSFTVLTESGGAVVDAFGRPVDRGDALPELERRSLQSPPLRAMQRARVNTPLQTGVRVIDSMLSLARGHEP